MMIEPAQAATWMLQQLERDGCIYQHDAVDYLARAQAWHLLRENEDGNEVLGRAVLEAFKAMTETTVVWVKSESYWRCRVAEDEPGRKARG